MVRHCRDILELGTAGIFCGWALQRRSFASGHCEHTQGLNIVGTAVLFYGWALRRYLIIGDSVVNR